MMSYVLILLHSFEKIKRIILSHSIVCFIFLQEIFVFCFVRRIEEYEVV